MFDAIPDNVVVCINEANNNILSKIEEEKPCYINNCSDNWQLNQKKMIIENGICVESCDKDPIYKYEYNGKCYNNCINGNIIINNNTPTNICKCELDQCLSCPSVALKLNLCTECNINYYPKENDPLNLGEYINCYKDLKGYYIDKHDLIYKKCYKSCEECELVGNDINHNCIECKENFIYEFNYSNYKNCYNNKSDYDYFLAIKTNSLDYLSETSIILNNSENNKEIGNSFEDNLETFGEYPTNTINFNFIQKEITFKLSNNENKTQKIMKTSNSSQIIFECFLDDYLNNICSFLNITNNSEILYIIRNNILEIYNPDFDKRQIILGEDNFIFQIINGKNELDLFKGNALNNKNISIIDFSQCEVKLKDEYNLNQNDSLIYFKKENINCKSSEKVIEYEVYEPYNFSKLNLSICDKNLINIYIKVEFSQETKKIYENLKELGYNMIDINDPFYKDICIPYTSSNKTDLILSDRINYIYYNKDSKCPSNCYFSSYIPNSLYLNCTCEVRSNEKSEDIKFNEKKIYESFHDVLKYSNFKILKCYKLIFTKKVITKNIGSITIIVFFMVYCIAWIIYLIKGISPITVGLKNIVLNKEEKIKRIPIINNFNVKKKENQSSHRKINKKILSIPPIKRKASNNANKKFKDKKKIIQKQNNQSNTIRGSIRNNDKSRKKNLLVSSRNMMDVSNKIEKLNIKENTINKKEKEEELKQLDVFELNELEYDEAVIQDKRTFIKTYFDILCREHQIIFTFFMCNDYNLTYIKFVRFIFIVTTDMAMSVFFSQIIQCIKYLLITGNIILSNKFLK